jgi:hypothetical protein
VDESKVKKEVLSDFVPFRLFIASGVQIEPQIRQAEESEIFGLFQSLFCSSACVVWRARSVAIKRL